MNHWMVCYFLLQFNFVGKLLGPKGNTLKRLQEETGCKMAILGKGSMRDKSKVSSFCVNTVVFFWIYVICQSHKVSAEIGLCTKKGLIFRPSFMGFLFAKLSSCFFFLFLIAPHPPSFLYSFCVWNVPLLGLCAVVCTFTTVVHAPSPSARINEKNIPLVLFLIFVPLKEL